MMQSETLDIEPNFPHLDLYVQAEVPVPVKPSEWQQWIESWLTVMGLSGPCELTLYLTDDLRMQTLNRQYRDRDSTTDVLAFAAQEADFPAVGGNDGGNGKGMPPLLLGDIAISVPTAQRQAEEQQHSLKDELAWLASHGLLHLLGWDHPDGESLQRMLRQQKCLVAHTKSKKINSDVYLKEELS
ncbi:MAG: rRNA maturation RNase YbeY [Synechococcus sp.]